MWSDLPLFPLNTVLFPGMVLPLRIFEDRYKLMIDHCLEKERPFGVVLIRRGQEVGDPAVPYEVGTTAVIAAATRLSNGRMNIATVGSERFHLLSVRHDLPYLVGKAEPWPLTGTETAQAWKRAEAVRTLFQEYRSLLAQVQGTEIEIEELPTDPQALALLVAIALQVPMDQKQNLLTQPTVVEILQAERVAMQRELLLLDYILRTQTEQWEGGHSGYLSRN
jgi:Lon protease-like protein